MFLSGLVFAFSLLIVYVGLCTALGSIFGGFDPNGMAVAGTTSLGMIVSPAYLWKFVILAFLSYLTIVSFTVFIATVFRSMGPSIPVVMLVVMGAYLIPMILGAISSGLTMSAQATYVEQYHQTPTMEELRSYDETVKTFMDITNVLKVVDPFYGIAATETTMEGVAVIDNLTLFGGIASNIVYSTLFFLAGMNIFRKRDVK